MRNWIAGQPNIGLRELVAAWLDKTLDDFRYVYEMRTKSADTWDINEISKWRNPYLGNGFTAKVTQGFDISKVNVVAVNMIDMLI